MLAILNYFNNVAKHPSTRSKDKLYQMTQNFYYLREWFMETWYNILTTVRYETPQV